MPVFALNLAVVIVNGLRAAGPTELELTSQEGGISDKFPLLTHHCIISASGSRIEF